jgi:predicted enzyme related to lactoylglutathione lyase
MAGELVYFTIGVPDPERARAFYGGLFGWGFSPGNIPGGYHVEGTNPSGGLHGGGLQGVRAYFQVSDIQQAVEQIRRLGGWAGEVKGSSAGWYADCRDDQGTEFSLYAPGSG